MALFLGMDAGGSRTRIAIADEQRELARVEGASVKVLRVAEGDAEARVGALLEELGAKAGVDLRYVSYTSVGLSGVTVAVVREFVAEALRKRVGGEMEIVGDTVIALDAAFSGGDGIVVIAGTGSNVVGRFDGDLFGVGGWGPVLGDEGSGHWIGVEAVKAALRAEDRGVVSCLLSEVTRAWGLQSVGELVAMANRAGADFAGLARVVASCAKGGDVLAAAVLERAGIELAEQVMVTHSKMVAKGFWDECEVGFTGSVLSQIAPVRKSFEGHLALHLPDASVLDREIDAVQGALWRARNAHVSL